MFLLQLKLAFLPCNQIIIMNNQMIEMNNQIFEITIAGIRPRLAFIDSNTENFSEHFLKFSFYFLLTSNLYF